MTTDILQTIVAHKRIEIAHQEEAVSRDFLIRQLETNPPRPAKSLKQSLATSPTGIIAEFKRRSPSKGGLPQELIQLLSFPDTNRPEPLASLC